MKRLPLWIVSFGVLLAGVGVWGQAFDTKDLSAQWQGIAQGPEAQQTQRVVFLISKADDGWKTVFNYIDLIAQGNGIPQAGSVSLRGPLYRLRCRGMAAAIRVN